MMKHFVVAFVLFACSVAVAEDAPRSVDPRLRIELFAEQPQIKTPTGIDVDARGRVWAIESNTHFRPEGYDGHPSDRLLVMADTNGDGRADDVRVFADGFTHAMSVAVRPVWMDVVKVEDGGLRIEDGGEGAGAVGDAEPLQVFLATRREILLLEDTDGDDVCDRRTVLAHLETEGNYPHNGLAGFAFDALGWMYFGFGENLGEEYELWSREAVGADGDGGAGGGVEPRRSLVLSGGGEGGNIYRMRPDGTQLSHWATGFWNPHASCVDAFGRLFTVDNDPDSRPPCRLLHVIEGGDYGYKFRNGRKGQHPFTAWNGEIPGTLPMVAGTGEAPSGIVAYEHDAFPEEYLGNLLVTSWGDHRIDRFRLQPKGASFESIAEPLIVGGEDFRPVGLALAPDGSLYCTDWVKRDYNLHGYGRVWRISAVDQEENSRRDAEAAEENVDQFTKDLSSRRLNVRRMAAQRLCMSDEGRRRASDVLSDPTYSVRGRIEAVWQTVQVPINQFDFGFTGTDSKVLHWPLDETRIAMVRLIGRAPQCPIRDYRDWNYMLLWPKEMTLPMDADLWELRAVTEFFANRDHPSTFVFREHQFKRPLIPPHLMSALVDDLARNEFELARIARDGFLAPNVQEDLLQQFFIETPEGLRAVKIASLLAMRKCEALSTTIKTPTIEEIIDACLRDANSDVRRLAVQWAAEEHMTDLRAQVEAVLASEPMTTDLFRATIAALDMLDGRSAREFEQAPIGKYVVPLLTNADTPNGVKVQALRLVEADEPQLTDDLLSQLLRDESPAVRLETIRLLAAKSKATLTESLLTIVSNSEEPRQVRAEAILALANAIGQETESQSTSSAMLELVPDLPYPLMEDMFRSLRIPALQDPEVAETAFHAIAARIGPRSLFDATDSQLYFLLTPETPAAIRRVIEPLAGRRLTSIDEWRQAGLAIKGENDHRPDSSEAGRRVFFHPNGPGCYKCHTVEGRGGRVGPDLSYVGRSFTREKLIDSILEPSREVSPQFTTWSMLTSDGVVHTGMIVHENEGRTILGDSEGRTAEISTYDVQERVPQRVSVMPEKLWERMTVQEFRDLLAYLSSLGVQRSGIEQEETEATER